MTVHLLRLKQKAQTEIRATVIDENSHWCFFFLKNGKKAGCIDSVAHTFEHMWTRSHHRVWNWRRQRAEACAGDKNTTRMFRNRTWDPNVMSPVRSKDEMVQRQTSKQVKDATPSLELFVLKALLYIEGNTVTLDSLWMCEQTAKHLYFTSIVNCQMDLLHRLTWDFFWTERLVASFHSCCVPLRHEQDLTQINKDV